MKSVGFSLSRRDGDSNRLLPSWGKIPYHKPGMLCNGSHGSPLVLIGTHFAGSTRTTPSGTNRSARSLKPCLPTEINFVFPHILPSSRGCDNHPNPGPIQSYSASWFTSRRNLLSDRCFQLPTASRQRDQALGGTGEMQSHPPGTLFIFKITITHFIIS